MGTNIIARVSLAALPAAVLLVLAGCSKDGSSEAQEQEVSEETLASAVSEAEGLSAVSDALKDAGLAQVFDGVAAYTLLAPSDAAFDALGAAGQSLRDPAQRPAMVAILRSHIVPGFLTPADISKAIELSDKGSVAMKTMSDHRLTFSAGEGGAIKVSGQDGASAQISGDAVLATNGVAIPVDGLLKQVAPPAE